MSPNEELARQILLAYANGEVDLTHVPALQEAVHEAVREQFQQAINESMGDFHKQQVAALAKEKAWYHQEINRILNERLALISPDQQKAAILQNIAARQAQLDAAEARLGTLQAHVDRSAQTLRPLRLTLQYMTSGLVVVVPYGIIFFLLWHLFMR